MFAVQRVYPLYQFLLKSFSSVGAQDCQLPGSAAAKNRVMIF
jgi:hypothetical protein